ncbi:protein S-acyltransferase 24-like [Patiria miniata]|uniref:Palmitoyltransferase n=1 Tax=Patiria miniata TaxID=46514 RepID=A0A914ACJ5_PATMI|nr:protein S-acyltransferase 24-like [Patiria miniata]
MDLPPIGNPYANFADVSERKKVSLADAIHNYHGYDEIVQLVEENPDAVHTKGWHGLTPLHKAALRGDPKITRLLLAHGASVNEPNDYGETALHYACKRGALVNIHALLEEAEVKGDVWHRDFAGRNCIHHAAAGGSVLTLHYLSEVHGMAFHDRDANGQTPLHVVCLQGFQDAIKYLLKNDRSELTWTDNNGNIPLHIACINALSEACWILLQHGNCSMLRVTNNLGQTPLQVLVEGRSANHHYLFKEMSYWADSKTPKLPPKGPLFTWYFMLTLPAHFFALILIVHLVIPRYGAVFVTAATACLIFYIGNQGHRLTHISRWSNPVYCGAFAAGLFHTILCFCCKLLPVLWPVNTYIHLLIDLPVLISIMYLYVVLLLRDPGKCTFSKAGPSTEEPFLGIRHVATGEVNYEGFCGPCEIVIPERARHCKLCEQCMLNMDHHCLFLLRCIAKDNHRHFVLLILLTLLSQILFLVYSFQYLGLLYPGHALWDIGVAIVHRHGWMWGLWLLNVPSILWGVSLLRMQLQLVAKGLTMVWHPKSNKMKNISGARLSRSDKLRNLRNFVAGRRTFTAMELSELQKV